MRRSMRSAMGIWEVLTSKLLLVDHLRETAQSLAQRREELQSSAQAMSHSVTDTKMQTETVAAATEEADHNARHVAEATTGLTDSVRDIAARMSEQNEVTTTTR